MTVCSVTLDFEAGERDGEYSERCLANGTRSKIIEDCLTSGRHSDKNDRRRRNEMYRIIHLRVPGPCIILGLFPIQMHIVLWLYR